MAYRAKNGSIKAAVRRQLRKRKQLWQGKKDGEQPKVLQLKQQNVH